MYTGPNIAKNGLVLCLDAGNIKSYPGTGTEWTDLSSHDNHATMYGSVPFSIDTFGCFDFATATGAASASSSLGFTFASNMIPRTGNFTLSCWVKNPNTSVGQVGLFSNAGGGDGYRFGVGRDAVYFLIGPDYTEGGIGYGTTLSDAIWYNITAVFNRTGASVVVFVNGAQYNSSSIPASQTQMQNNPPGLVRSACCSIYTGKLATFFVYNRDLSSSEILQNYIAHKTRYGL